MESNLDINEIVDSLLEDIESTLSKLEKSFTQPTERTLDLENEKNINLEEESKSPFPSVRYPTPDDTLSQTETTVEIANKTSEIENENVSKVEIKPKKTYLKSYSDINKEPIPKPDIEIKNKASKTPPNELIRTAISNTLKQKKTIAEEDHKCETEEDTEIEFLDIDKGIRLIHFYGPPSSGKTTFAIQSAIEIYPRKTYYFITSHSASTIKRIKQMISNDRWIEYNDIKKNFFPIATQNLDELFSEIEKIKTIEPDQVGLIIIDHLTDYIRGEIYKEEQRMILREILEQLYLLADDKNCKILILNGYSYNNAAPAGDIIESYCDMSVTIELDSRNAILIHDEEKIPIFFDNSGIRNLHINIYY